MKPALSSVSVVGALATYPEPVIQCGWSTFAVSLRDDDRRPSPSTAGIIRAPLSPRNPVDTIVRPLIHHNGGIAAAGRRLQIRRSFGGIFRGAAESSCLPPGFIAFTEGANPLKMRMKVALGAVIAVIATGAVGTSAMATDPS